MKHQQAEMEPMSIWVIYWNPKDAPHQYVLREWQVLPDGQAVPSERCVVRDRIDHVRLHLPLDVYSLGRCNADDPAIAEVWI